MANNDFFIRFGSNADVFARELGATLDKVDKRIKKSNDALKGLGGGLAGGNLTDALTHQAAEDSRRKGTRPASVDPGIATESKEILADLKKVGLEMTNLVSSLSLVALAMGGITAEGKKLKSTIQAQERALRKNLGGNGPFVDPQTNQVLGSTRPAPGKKGSAYFRQPGTVSGPELPNKAAADMVAGARRMGGALAAAAQQLESQAKVERASVSGVTKGQLDTAAVDRIVKAVNKVEKAVRSGKTGATDQAGVGGAVGQAVAAALQALGGTKAVTGGKVSKARKDAVETEALAATEGLSRSQKKTKNRLDAQLARDSAPTITKEERDRRRGIQAALDLPADEASFRSRVGRKPGQLVRDDLIKIAKTFNEQTGSAVGVAKGATIEKLIQGILGARAAHAASGFATRDDLNVKGRVVAEDRIDKSVAKLIGPLGKLSQSTELAAARLVTSQDVSTGGSGLGRRPSLGYVEPRQETEDLHLLNEIRSAKLAEIKALRSRAKEVEAEAKSSDVSATQRAFSADAAQKHRAKADALQQEVEAMAPQLEAARLGFRGGNVRLDSRSKGRREYGASVGPGEEALVHQAEAKIVAFEKQVLDFTAQQARKASFNPYDPEHQKGIGGTGDAPKGARQALGAVRRATQAIDDIYTEFAKGTKLGESLAREHSLSGLFSNPEYRKGYQQRQGDYNPLFPEQGTSPRAQFEARGIDAARRGELFQIFREATGQSVAGGKAYMGSKKDIAREVPGLRFNRRTGYSFENEAIPVAKAKEIGKASDAYARAQLHLARVLENAASSEDDHTKARNRLENRAQHFLNEVYGATGSAPPLAKFTGVAPAGESNIAADRVRQDAIAKRNAENAAKRLTPEQRVAEQKKAIKDNEAQLAKVTLEQAAAAKAATAATAKVAPAIARLLSALTEEQKAALKKATADEAAAVKARLTVDRKLTTGTAAEASALKKFSTDRGKETGAYLNPYMRDAQGYDAGFGYGPPVKQGTLQSLNAESKKLQAQEANARRRALAIFDTSTLAESVAAKKAVAAELAVAEQRARIAETLAGQKARLKEMEAKAPKGKAAAAAPEQAAVQAAVQSDRDALVAQRKQLTTQRNAVDKERKALLATDTTELTSGQKGALTRKINQLLAKYTKLMAEAETLDEQIKGSVKGGGGGRKGGGGAGAGAGGAGAGGTGGAGDGATNGILKQILAAVNRVNTTLKGGVAVTPKGGGTGGTATTAAKPAGSTTAKPAAIPRYTDDERAASLAAFGTRRAQQQSLRDVRNSQDTIRLEQERVRLASMQAAASQKVAAADEQEARAKARLTAITGQLNAEARHELATLEKLVKEGASAERIARQQATAYLALARSMGQQGVSRTDVRQAGAQLLGGASGKKFTQQMIQDVEHTASAVHGYQTVDQAFARGVTPGGLFGEQSLFTQAMFGNHGFWSRIMSSTGTFIVRNFAAGFVFGMTNALQQVIKQAILTESTFVRVSGALEATGKDVGTLRYDLQDISTDYGTNLNEIYQVAAGLAGLFKNSGEIASGVRVVSELETISSGALNATEAMGTLASITGAYGDELSTTAGGFQHVADVLTSVQNNIGSNIEVTAEGVGRLSGLAKQLGLSFEETAVYTAQIAKLTNQTGGAAGEQFSRILGALQTGRGQSAVTGAFTGDAQESLEKSFGKGDYGGVMKTLLQNWNKLSAAQQRNIAVSVAGQRQAAAFAALFNNSAAVLNDVVQAENSDGDAKKRMDQITKTLNRQIAILGSNLQDLANNLVRSGLLDFFGIFLRVTNTLFAGLNKVLAKLNDFADSNGFTKFIKTATFALIGFGLAALVLRKSLIGLKATLIEMRGVQAITAAGGGTVRGGVSFLRPSTLLGLGGAPGRPPGLPSTRFGNYSSGLSASAARAEQRAASIRTFNTNAAGGTISARADLQRLGYSSQARVQNALAAAATRANAALGRLGTGMRGLATSSVAADLALVAVVLAIIAIGREHSRQKQLAKDADEAYKRQFGENRGKTADQIAAESTTALGGQAQAAYEESNPSNLAVGWAGIRGLAKGAVKGVISPHGFQGAFNQAMKEELSQTLGVEAGANGPQQFGLGQANKLYADALSQFKPGQSTDQLMAVQDDFNKKIADAATKINQDSSLSGTQKSAAIGALTQATSQLQKQVADLLTVAQGVSSAMNIGVEGIQNLQLFFSTEQSIGGVSRVGGLDISGIMKDLVATTGITPGSNAARILDSIAVGNATLVEVAKANKAFLRKEVIRLNSLLKAAEAAGDTDTANALRSQILGAITQLDQAWQPVIQNLQDSLDALADTDYRGRTKGARAVVQAIRKQIRVDGATPALLIALQSAQDALVQAQFNELDGARKAAQNNAKSKNAIRTAGRAEMQAAIQLAVKTGSADLLRQVIESAGKVSVAIARQAINDVQAAMDAYQKSLAAYTALRAQFQNQVHGIHEGPDIAGPGGPPQAPEGGPSQAQIDGLNSAVQNALPDKWVGDMITGLDVPGVADSIKDATKDAGAVRDARQELVQARLGLRLAIAQARGNEVKAAKIEVQIAQAQLVAAKQDLAHAKGLAEKLSARSAVLQARAQIVSARAAARDAVLQDRLDTIDFNLQMGKITQSSAIQALQQILKTADLTRQQRRDLLLKIKGMKDELANGQWNFGDIKLPTPYQMRRYIAERRQGAQQSVNQIADQYSSSPWMGSGGGGSTSSNRYETHNVNIQIDGADVAKVKQIIREVVGTGSNTRTSQARRGR